MGGGGAASMGLGFCPACEAVTEEKGEPSAKVRGMAVSRAHLVSQARVSCHTVTRVTRLQREQ